MQAVAAPPLGARQRGRRSALLTSTTSIRGTRARAWPAWLRPSLADLLLLGCVLVALWGGSVMLSADGDPARHLTVGEHILASGAIPHADVFSHTMAGQPFVPYEWLAEVASALSYRLAGLAGPVLLHGMAIGLSFAVLFRHLRHRGHPVVLALAVTLLAAMASTLHWLARPHVFTFLGTAVFSFVLDGWHAGRLRSRWLWALAPAMALWANVHGGFLIGFILLGAYAGADALHLIAGDGETRSGARRRLARLGPPALATLGATLLNP
ncbi:MAG: hypothetical protein ACRDJN_03285, partial [Chloroflexota bacterium]